MTASGKRGPCPSPTCGAKKACETYPDGHKFCFKCSQYFPPYGSTASTKHKSRDSSRRKAEDIEALWSSARHVLLHLHPYLRRKGVITGFGLRTRRGKLLVPVRTLDGQLTSLQKIGKSGDKRFARDCELGNGFFAIGRMDKAVYICEGVATALTIYMATGQYTVAALSANRMLRIAWIIRNAYPDAEITVCADNDGDKA